jgi:hypothetical protein
MKKDLIASSVAGDRAAMYPRLTACESGVLPRMGVKGHSERPSWDEVDEYLREGKHRSLVERYSASHPDFAEVLRWMRNDHDAEEIDADSTRTPVPTSARSSFASAHRRQSSSLPPPIG